MSQKKVLIVAYYWPPSGGSGVQRWLKFVKYLPQFGWKPYVFTPENPSFDIRDESLLKDVPPQAEVIKLPIWEPYEAFGKLSKIFSGSKKKVTQTNFAGTKQSSLFSRLSVWVRGNMIIPDPRKFWVKPAVKFLKKYLQENDIQTIITTGPPHSMHLIGLKLKQQNPSLKWIVDMRDPWSEWGFLETLNLSKAAFLKHKQLERTVLTTADHVVTVTPTWVRQFEKLSDRSVTLLTNGFDEDDFASFKPERQPKFTVRHIGIVNERCNPRPFMEVVETLCGHNHTLRNDLRIEFVGSVESSFIQYVSVNPLMNEVTRFVPPVWHTEIIKVYETSSALLLILTGYKNPEAYLPGKLFEYLATGLEVIGVGPVQGDAATLLRDSGAGEMTEAKDEIERMILTAYTRWQDGNNSIVNKSNSDQYTRKSIAARLIDML